jgi:hypothetical protein
MLPLYEDPWFTFHFAADRLIPRFHLEGVEAGRRVSVFRIDPDTGERLGSDDDGHRGRRRLGRHPGADNCAGW